MVRLGQNFLVDRNILGVIERLAALEPDDVVLEIGGGEGVLSERLAASVAHLHVVELDRQLEEGLRDVLSGFTNVTLWMVDALALDLPALDPAPTAVVANLPYSIAATVAGTPSLVRLKSTIRYCCLWPPPRCRAVLRP